MDTWNMGVDMGVSEYTHTNTNTHHTPHEHEHTHTSVFVFCFVTSFRPESNMEHDDVIGTDFTFAVMKDLRSVW